MKAALLVWISGVLALSACSHVGQAPEVTAATEAGKADHPEARLYDASINTKVAVDAALLKAEAEDRLVMIVMGANWCHDSRAFAGWMETPRFQKLIADHYELVYVNIGMPQTGDGHNLEVGERFGVTDIEGTPSVLIISPLGQLLNADTAKAWRNAASRSEDAIYEELNGFTAA
ncbi:thioredoxin family protein [Pontixanthobacter aestiaquae]|uniref:Thioredoxin family protein n=1 Tax=Pontixanthobacter aestiaquae TaxID=1509367 RepID=A0A844Z3K8_9SPHN|nr:thioredoxin family protein [Pontixanthobacter aestiaquae]MDN3646497.1 thioredoxin family protein [Pontixanthobacter aestiaquae]MXO82515.1 thioredoxin family protein [Pontixanthobacter aestiaquae]